MLVARWGRGPRRRGSCRAPAVSTVKRRRLFDRVPFFHVRRDHHRQDIFVGPIAGSVCFRIAFLDADFGDEGQALELSEAASASAARLGARIIGLEAECGIENGFYCAAIDVGGLGVTRRGAV